MVALTKTEFQPCLEIISLLPFLSHTLSLSHARSLTVLYWWSNGSTTQDATSDSPREFHVKKKTGRPENSIAYVHNVVVLG